MSEDWREGYRRALTTYLIKQGTPLGSRADTYGWIADDYREVNSHLASCGYDPEKTEKPVEDEWYEFTDTFDENNTTQHGMQIKVTCNCGKLTGRTLRIRGTASELILGLLSEDFGG